MLRHGRWLERDDRRLCHTTRRLPIASNGHSFERRASLWPLILPEMSPFCDSAELWKRSVPHSAERVSHRLAWRVGPSLVAKLSHLEATPWATSAAADPLWDGLCRRICHARLRHASTLRRSFLASGCAVRDTMLSLELRNYSCRAARNLMVRRNMSSLTATASDQTGELSPSRAACGIWS